MKILVECGFDTASSVEMIDENNIESIEKYVNTNLRHLLHETFYSKEQIFSFRVGHRMLLLSLSQKVQQYKDSLFKPTAHHPILAELITTSENNYGKEPKQRRYSNKIKYFAAFLYMVGGRYCYELLSKNLPLPQVDTICKLRRMLTSTVDCPFT